MSSIVEYGKRASSSFLADGRTAMTRMQHFSKENKSILYIIFLLLFVSFCIVPECRRRYRRLTFFKKVPMPQYKFDFELFDRDFSDEVLEMLFGEILEGTHKLVAGLVMGRNSPSFKLDEFSWAVSPELAKYFAALVWPNKNHTNWYGIFRQKELRQCLCEAIIMRVLYTHVFQELLFGASKDHIELLERLDVEMVEIDGFGRLKMRTVTNVAYLRNRALSEVQSAEPPLFWKNVNKIAAQLMTMLLPIYDIDYSFGSDTASTSLTPIYNELHRLVAKAAYINLAIRCSTKIVDFVWLQPGDRYQFNQTDHHPTSYQQSKEYTKEAMMRVHDKSSLCARVHISVAPSIKSYSLLPRIERTDGPLKVYNIQKPRAVYYHGFDDDEKNENEYDPLRRPNAKFYFLHYWRKWASWGACFVCLVIIPIVLGKK